MSPRVKKYLFEILRFIEELESIISEFEQFEQFQSDAKSIRALERLYEIIGEALRKALHEHPELPITDTRKIIALRNILAHQYDNISAKILWETSYSGIPILKSEVGALIKE